MQIAVLDASSNVGKTLTLRIKFCGIKTEQKTRLSGGLSVMTKQAYFTFVMVGLVPTICKPLICIDPRHKAEDDDGKASGLPTAWNHHIGGFS
ncbi:hypothetical protein [Pannonibacter carbonis]|uniref:hypothetical protein n=1 Tax=Pannonibacter carbonis TaxID=2067569 RepID=UPI000D102AF4|nr:hypothetical protein [Pannonibacter carbonis]